MRRFLKNILLFAALTLAGLAAIEFLARHSGQIDYVRYKADRMKLDGDTVKTVFIGSSVTFQGIDPAYWADGHAFNLGSNAAYLEMQYYLVKAVLPLLPNLETLSLEFTQSTFYAGELESGNLWYMWIPYTLYYGTDKYGALSRYAYEMAYPPELRRRLLPWKAAALECDSNGHSVRWPLAARRADWNRAFSATDSIREVERAERVGQNIGFFTAILDMCRNRGVEVMIRVMPMHPSYVRRFDKRQLRFTYRELYALKAKYHFRVMDYLDDPRLADDDMDDITHLNTDVGAAKWTRIIYDDCNAGRDDSVMPRLED
jgi:hypothetical protein